MRKTACTLAICCLFFPLFASVEDSIQRIHAHLLIEDYPSALIESEYAIQKYGAHQGLYSAHIRSLAAMGREQDALREWRKYHILFEGEIPDRTVLEELSWGVLNKGIHSPQYAIRMASLVGSFLTQDVRAVKNLIVLLQDSNAILRSIAVQLTSHYLDAPLQDELARMLKEEKIWLVRLEVIKAIGKMRMHSQKEPLKQILANDRATHEEKALAIEAIVTICEDIDINELSALAKSDRAGLRQLAVQLAAHLNLVEAKELILPLTQDPRPDVRIAALNAFGLFYVDHCSYEEAKSILSKSLEDTHPSVAITASWVEMILDPINGKKHMEKWLVDEYPENRRLAASALASSGSCGVSLALHAMQKNQDPYVRANLALGLVGQRIEVQKCCDILYQFLNSESRMWMVDNRQNPLFEVLCPSELRHTDQFPNYPVAIDQLTRLNLLSILAIMEDNRAQDALKNFLQKKTLGITGAAAATLLQEGDEEALEVVRDLLEDSDVNVRMQAALVLAFLGKDGSVIETLQGFYYEADHQQKIQILEALGRIGTFQSYEFYLNILEEPFQILRVIAASSLLQCLNR